MTTTRRTRPAASPAYYLGRPARGVADRPATHRPRPARRPDVSEAIATDRDRKVAQLPRNDPMKVPFNILDFLDRAEHVYGDRIGVDRRTRPARRQLGTDDMAAGRRARQGDGRRPRRPRRRSWRADRDRLAQQRPPPRRPVRRLRLRTRRRADQLPPQRRRSPLHRRAVRRLRPPRRSRARRSARRRRRAPPVRARPRVRRSTAAFRPATEPVGRPQRGRHRLDQLHQRHNSQTKRRRADPPQPVPQRAHVRLARRRRRP